MLEAFEIPEFKLQYCQKDKKKMTPPIKKDPHFERCLLVVSG
jgi:hypothetical protein